MNQSWLETELNDLVAYAHEKGLDRETILATLEIVIEAMKDVTDEQ